MHRSFDPTTSRHRTPPVRPSVLRRTGIGQLLLAAAWGLAGCGGGDGAADPAPNPPPAAATLSLNGVAAVGAPLVGATVRATCSAGTPATATTTGSGSYSLDVAGGVLPCLLRASGGTAGGTPHTQMLHAWLPGAAGGTSARANLTPLTELMAAHLAGGPAAAFFDAADAARFAQITPAAASSALDAVRSGLPAALRSALGSTDPLTAEFQANGTGLDAVLDQLRAALAAAGLSLDAAATRLAAGHPLLPPYLSGPATGIGQAGEVLQMSGHALPATPVVRFGSTAAASASTNEAGTQISATVPAGLAAGVVNVTVEGVAGAVAYTVQVPPPPEPVPPVVNGFSPASGPAGTVITVTGTGFLSTHAVTFGGTTVTPTALSATSLTLAVPAGLADGAYKLSVAGVESAGSFTLSAPVTPPPTGAAGATWAPVAALPLTFNACRTNYSGVATSGTRWVAVGDSGCIRSSADGDTWTEGSQPYTGFSWADVIYASGRFVAVGTSGYSGVSTDGLTWTRSERTRLGVALNAVVWTGSRYLAVSDTAAVPNYGINLYTSTDGLNWTEGKVTADAGASASLLKLVSVASDGNGTLVAVGGTSLNGRVAWRSTDGGSTWAYVGETFSNSTGFILGSGGSPATSVAYGNGTWVAIGGLADWAVSSDGIGWATGKIDPSEPVLTGINRVFFDGAQFIAVGRQKRIYTSPDGRTWTRRLVDATISPALTRGNFRGIAGSATGRLVVTGTADNTSGASGFVTSLPPAP